MRLIYILLLFVLNTSILLSQVLPICGTDKVMKKHLQSDYFKNQQAAISKELRNQQSFNTKIIPLVFHIIHNGHPIGEDENVSVEQIENAVSILNEDFNTLFNNEKFFSTNLISLNLSKNGFNFKNSTVSTITTTTNSIFFALTLPKISLLTSYKLPLPSWNSSD